MLRKSLITLGSWLVGILGVVAIFSYYQPQGFAATIAGVGIAGVTGWVALTIVARFSANEATVIPLAVLGFRMSRGDAFWISWVRTFANQFTPLAGAAAYAHMIRRHAGVPWSQIVALGQPQLLLVAAAISFVGLAATLANVDRLQASALGFGLAYLAIIVASLALATGAHWLVEALPRAISSRAEGTSTALKAIRQRQLVVRLVLFHVAATLLRGSRIGILFAAAGVDLDWAALLLIVALAESHLLINITPGGLGLREGAILGGAALVGIATPVAASVALIDRLFMVAITTLLAAPAFAVLRKPRAV